MKKHEALPQCAFLIRCWQDGHACGDDASSWRFSVEEIGHDRRRFGFASLDDVVTFLDQWLQDVSK
ncbi:MAG: hypothetical protein U0822_02765 [Anaerolineae bacterium]